jgi:hypothetical protein
MNTGRYVIGSIVVFVVLYALEYFFHGVILADQYEAIKHIYRPEDQMGSYMLAMILGELLFAFGFCFIFLKGYEGKGCAEGVRYGLYIGIAFGVSNALISYAIFPLSGWIMLGYFFGYPIMMMIIGAVFASIYKPKA